jgi:hypothetical protein
MVTAMTMDGDYDGDSTTEQSMFVSFVVMASRREERILFFYFEFFLKIILFFVFSTDLTACSFDHSCRKPT